MTFEYERSPDKIYEQSFSIIRKEADLSSFSNLEEKIAVRMIHALGFIGPNKTKGMYHPHCNFLFKV